MQPHLHKGLCHATRPLIACHCCPSWLAAMLLAVGVRYPNSSLAVRGAANATHVGIRLLPGHRQVVYELRRYLLHPGRNGVKRVMTAFQEG